MLDRLKSLPLTILLTLLIWMYAESQVNSAHIETATISMVPVLVSGPPEMLTRYQIILENSTVNVDVNGSQDQIAALRGRSTAQSGIYAYLDISSLDLPTVNDIYRNLRFVTPAGITVTSSPQAGFRLVEIKK